MANSPRFKIVQCINVRFARAPPYALTTGFSGLRRLTFRNEETQLVWQRGIPGTRGRNGREDKTPQTTL
jgi:hypothetical protein